MATAKRKSPTKKRTNKVLSGSGGLSFSKLNWRTILTLVLIVSLVGGFLVFRSRAAAAEWKPNNPDITVASIDNMVKKDGSSYWYTMEPPFSVFKSTQGGSLPQYSEVGRLVLRNSTQGSGIYCAEVQTFAIPAGVRFSGANAKLPSAQAAEGRFKFGPKTKGEACVTADLSIGALTVILERQNVEEENTVNADQPIIVHRLFKKETNGDITKKCSELSDLKFCDDFDGASGSLPDSTKWNVFKSGSSWGSHCWTNKPENISTDGTGNLKLTLIDTKTNKCTNWYGDPSTVTSGGMDTQGKFTTKYGKFEIRTKLACAKSVWGSIWLSTGTGPSWPQSGEIDMYEIGYDKQNKLQQTIHAGKSSSDKYSVETYTEQTDRYCEDYHVYGVEWRKGYIQFTLDGKPTKRITEADGLADATNSGKTPYWPFDSYDLRLLIDLQYGKNGTWTGTPNLSELPSSMLVDYVRVYN